jgi:hypothetical protein
MSWIKTRRHRDPVEPKKPGEHDEHKPPKLHEKPKKHEHAA